MAHDVFVSYHTNSSASIVKKIVARLEEQGIKCWFAPRDAGGSYAGKITQAIEHSAIFLVVLNKAASDSRNVLTEMNTAFNKRSVEILPFHVADDDSEISADAKYYLQIFHKIDARRDLDAAIEELTDRILRHLGREKKRSMEPQSDLITLTYCGQTHRVKAETIKYGDGCTYIGEVVNGKRRGKGILTWGKDTQWAGDVYEGEWVDDKRTGKGKYTWANGNVYEGDFVNGKQHGTGRYSWGNASKWAGDVYEGDWVYDSRTGRGKYTWACGNIYQGDFVDGKQHGKGKKTWANGDVYEGDWINDVRTGMGKCTWPNGDVYEGEYLDDNRTGKGKYIWGKDSKWAGDVYVGDFLNNKMCGKGKYTWANGDTYEGDWLDDKRTGYGIFKPAKGKILKGRFEDNKFIGK